nr:lecithin retinol acyltransferase family protein [Lachnospiraceae bacterium]
MNWQPGDCRPGDMIRVRIGSFYHYGVFVSEEEVISYGLPPIERFANEPDRLKVLATDIDVFACGGIVEIAVPDRKERRKRLPAKKIIETARSRIGEDQYDLLHNNCEHFANECVFGESRSLLEEAARERWLAQKARARDAGQDTGR